MKKKKKAQFEERPDGKPSYDAYAQVMVPHWIAQYKKDLHIKLNDKEGHRTVVKFVKNKARKRYSSEVAAVLLEDMRFVRRNANRSTKPTRYAVATMLTTVTSAKKQDSQKDPKLIESEQVLADYNDNKEILSSLRHISSNTRDWIDMRRVELLAKTSKFEQNISDKFHARGIKTFKKMPFVIDRKIHFTQMYIPIYRLAIDISLGKKSEDAVAAAKEVALRTAGIKYMRLAEYDAIQEDIDNVIISAIS